MRAFKLLTVLILGVAVSGCSESMHDQQSMNRPAPDMTMAQTFVPMVASSDKFEIASSKMALAQSRNSSVRRIAKRMISDHTKSSKKMAAILAANGMPAPPPALMPHHQHELDELSSASDFDNEYLEAQDHAHRHAIKLFQFYSENGDNAALRGFAAKTLPTLREHREMIEKVREKMSQG